MQLIAYKKLKGHDITVVFDGWKSGSHREEQETIGGVRVIYSRIGEKADTVIKNALSRDKRGWIVISSDRDITAHAWACGSVPVASSRFAEILESAGSFPRGEYEPLDADERHEARKGSPMKPSRKEKALMRAIRKL